VTGLVGGTGIQGVTGLIGGTGIQGVTGLIGGTGIRGVTGITFGITGATNKYIAEFIGTNFLGNSTLYHDATGYYIINPTDQTALNIFDVNTNSIVGGGLVVSDRGSPVCELIDDGGSGGGGNVQGRISLWQGTIGQSNNEYVHLNAAPGNWIFYDLCINDDEITVGGYTFDVNGLTYLRNNLVMAGDKIVYVDHIAEATGSHGIVLNCQLVNLINSANDTSSAFNFLNYSHDNLSLNFDSYYDVGWWSSDAGSNFRIYKINDVLRFSYAADYPSGETLTAWSSEDASVAIAITNAGQVVVNGVSPTGGYNLTVPTLAVDHIGEKTTSHNIILDNNLTVVGSATIPNPSYGVYGVGFGVAPVPTGTGFTQLSIGSGLILGATPTAAGQGIEISQNIYLSTGWQWKRTVSDLCTQYQQINGTHAWFADASGTADVVFTPTLRMTLATTGLTVVGAFGCNAAAAQTAYASGGALAAYATGAYGLNSDANMSALHALVVKMRAALVANGIMS
jgi:hypothetical protein